MTWSSFVVRSTWMADGLSAADVGARVLRQLQALTRLAPAMSNWVLGDQVDMTPVPLEAAAPDLTAFVERNVSRDDWGEPAPEEGYAIVAQGSQRPTASGSTGAVNVRLLAGSQWKNRAEFEVGSPHLPKDPALLSYPIYRGALEALVDAWPCPWAVAEASAPDSPRAGGRPRRPSPFDIAWIGYLSAPLAARLKPPADLRAEATPGGGVILSAVDTLIDQANKDHIRRSRLLEQIMIDRVGVVRPPGFGPANHPARAGPY